MARVFEPHVQLHRAERHVLQSEIARHPSYFCTALYDLLRAHNIAFVIADTAGKFGYAEEVTADFVYVRLHGSTALYASDYSEAELQRWASLAKGWMTRRPGRDVYVYFDNDAKVHAPHNAMRLAEIVSERRTPKHRS